MVHYIWTTWSQQHDILVYGFMGWHRKCFAALKNILKRWNETSNETLSIVANSYMVPSINKNVVKRCQC